jgi:hypothetical protein
MANLTSPSQGVQGVQQVPYMNNLGQTLTVTEVNGTPITYVPPGYIRATDQQAQMQATPAASNPLVPMPTLNLPSSGAAGMAGAIAATPAITGRLFGMAEGGSVQDTNLDNMYRMATKFLGYSGPKTRESLAAFRNSSPSISAKMRGYDNAMSRGGLMTKGYQEGGVVATAPIIPLTTENLAEMQASAVQQTMQPRQATIQQLVPQAADFIAPTAGQAAPVAPMAEAATLGQVQLAQPVAPITAAQVTPATAADAVQQMTAATQAAQGAVSPQAQVQAAQQMQSSVTGLEAAQGTAIMMTNPVQREIQEGELISGVADAEKAAVFTEQVQAAQATPSKQATVQGQLEGLMAQFEGGATPAWAAGAMRTATATLAARGLGASSLAGQAVIQATMESALPIAQIDAQTQASFETQNLSNRQQRAMLAAQQRAAFVGQEFDQAFQSRVANAAKISDVANMNFTAEQQIALENSRIANTMNLQNLNNRQQASVQNAQSFLSVDMANLSNQQQTDLFKAQQRVQSLFTDQAAQNAAQQFNASSQNQVDQFFASLAQQTAQFNATQANAQSQFNVGQVNTIERFNAEINNQRDQFNAQNRLIIDQSNAQWRREIATANTAAVNRANELNATALLGLSQSAYNNLWQYYRDNMEWAWTSAENERQRVTNIAIAQLQADSSKDIQSMKEDYTSSSNFGSAVFKFLTTDISNSLLGGLFG